MKIFATCFILIFFVNCSTEKQISKVLGKGYESVAIDVDSSTHNRMFDSIDNPHLSFSYIDILGYGYTVSFNSLNNKFFINTPTFLSQMDALAVPYFIYPKEKLTIKQQQDGFVLFLSTSQQRSNELRFFKDMISNKGPLYMGVSDKYDTVNISSIDTIYSMYKQINDLRLYRLNYLDSFAVENSISEQFRDIAKNTINNFSLKDSLIIIEKYSKLLRENNIYDKILSSKLDVINKNFHPFNASLGNSRRILKMLLHNKNNINVTDSEAFDDQVNTINKYYNGEMKELLLTQAFIDTYAHDITVSYEAQRAYRKNVKNKSYKAVVMRKQKDSESNAVTKDYISSLARNKNYREIEDIIKIKRGKLILIDFWASWCKPCRQELPYSAVLRKTYSDNNVEFLYFSIDKDPTSWKAASLSENLNQKNNFIFTQFDSTNFAKKYNINAIPRYMLIGKDGKIIDTEAPYPSNPKLKELIDKHLKD